MIFRSSSSKSSISFCSDSERNCLWPEEPETESGDVAETGSAMAADAADSMSESTFSYSLSFPLFLEKKMRQSFRTRMS